MIETQFRTPPAASESAILGLEKKLGSPLPPILRRYYITSNGGNFSDPRDRDCDWRLHPVFDNRDRKLMKRTAEDIMFYTELALKNNSFPRNGISIAHDYSMHRQLFIRYDEATGALLEEIHLFVSGKKCESYASDLRAAIEQVRTPETVLPDPTRTLPVFRYYADPLKSGVISISGESCQCCGNATGYIYSASFYSTADESRFCPWCIADGSAAKKFDGEFNDSISIGMGEIELPESVVDEVALRTPSFFSFQQEQWWAHCNDAGQFIGEIEHVEHSLLASDTGLHFRQSIQENQHLYTDADWEWLIATPSKKRNVACYVFRCLHCGELGGYSDCC